MRSRGGPASITCMSIEDAKAIEAQTRSQPRDDLMNVKDLEREDEGLYFVCLEDWSEEIREAGDHKERWYARMRDRGLRVKLAVDDGGCTGGMIQYLPIEISHVEGRDLYFIYCVWVHAYKKGRGDFRGRGMGKTLLEAAEEDARKLGAKGMAAWGIGLPFWMRASWFKKQGYARADKDGAAVLMWKPFTHDAEPPRWTRQRKRPQAVPGKVAVTAFVNGWCPAQNIVYERARRAAAEFGEKVVFEGVDTSDRNTFLEWGISDGLFVDGKAVRTGPPPSYEKLRSLIARKVKRLG
jgi:GNAT superfamily N-acetyltransferase